MIRTSARIVFARIIWKAVDRAVLSTDRSAAQQSVIALRYRRMRLPYRLALYFYWHVHDYWLKSNFAMFCEK